MGLVYSEITLSNPVKSELQSIVVKCFVVSGSTYLVVPQKVIFENRKDKKML